MRLICWGCWGVEEFTKYITQALLQQIIQTPRNKLHLYLPESWHYLHIPPPDPLPPKDYTHTLARKYLFTYSTITIHLLHTTLHERQPLWRMLLWNSLSLPQSQSCAIMVMRGVSYQFDIWANEANQIETSILKGILYMGCLSWHYKYKNTNTNTNNFIFHRIKNNKTLATSYFSMVNMYNLIQLFTIKLT